MRRRLVGLCWLTLSAAVAWVFWLKPHAEVWLRKQVEERGSAALSQPVFVEAVHLHPLLLRCDLVGLRVGPPSRPRLTCRRWSFRAAVTMDSPFSYFFLTLAGSQVEGPSVRVDVASSTSGGFDLGSHLSSWVSRLPWHAVRWEEGAVQVHTVDGSEFHLQESQGEVRFSPLGVSAEVKGSSTFGNLSLRAHVTPSSPSGKRGGNVHLSVGAVPLDLLSRWVPESLGRFNGRAAVVFDTSIQDYSTQGWRKALMDARGSARFSEGLWRPAGLRSGEKGIPFRGHVEWDRGEARIRSLVLFDGLTLKGRVFVPDLKGELEGICEKLPLAVLRESGLAVFRRLPEAGYLKAEGSLRGPFIQPHVRWSGTVSGSGWPGFHWPEVSSEGQWKDGWLWNRFRLLSGEVELSGTLGRAAHSPQQPSRLWTVRLTGINLRSWAEINGWPKVNGTLGGSFSWVGLTGTETGLPRAEGELYVDDLTWGLHRETGPVRGRLIFDDRGVRVRGEANGFECVVTRSSGTWWVEKMDYTSGDFRCWAQGILRDAAGGMEIDGGLRGMGLAGFPPLTKWFPHLDGRVETEGRLFGRWPDPVYTGTVRAENVQLFSTGGRHSLAAEVRGGREGISVSAARWDHFVRAEGTWVFGQGGRVSLDVDPVDAVHLFDNQVESSTVAGTFSGQMSLSFGNRSGLEGWVRLRQEKGRWGSLSVDEGRGNLSVHGSRWELNPVEIISNGRPFLAKGQAQLSSSGNWEGRGDARGALSIGSTVWAATWTWRGNYLSDTHHGQGTLASVGPVRLHHGKGEILLGRLSAEGGWSPGQWVLNSLTSDQGLWASAAVDRVGGAISGSWTLRSWPLRAFMPEVKIETLGVLDATGTLMGQWPRPEIQSRLTLSRARWGGREVKGAGTLRGSAKSWEMGDLKFQWDGGGVVTGQATVDLPSKNEPGAVYGQGSFVPSDGSDAWTGRARLAWEEESVVVQELGVRNDSGAWWVRPGSRAEARSPGRWNWHLENELRNIRLGPLHFFGRMDFDGHNEGLQRWEGRWTAMRLWLNQRLFDGDRVGFALSPDRLEFQAVPGSPTQWKGRIHYADWPQLYFENVTLLNGGRQKMALSGAVGPTEWDFFLQGRGLPAETLLSLADIDWPIRGDWDVRMRGRGSLAHPNVEGHVEGHAGAVGPLLYDDAGADLLWLGDTVSVTNGRFLRRNGYRLEGRGGFPVRDDNPWERVTLDVHLTDGKLAFLKDIWPLCRSGRGRFSGAVRVEPSRGAPRVSGSLEVHDGQLRLRDYAPRIRDIDGLITFQNDHARVEHVRARSGLGWVEMAGDIGIHGLSPVDYDLLIQTGGGRGVYVEVPQLSVPPGPLLSRFSFISDRLKGLSYGEPTGSLRVRGPHGEHVISGEAVLEGTHFTYPPSKSGGEIPGPRWWKNFWRQARWDVRFKTGKDTWYRNEYVNVNLKGGLRLSGAPGDWTVNGRVDSEEGVINYLGQLFQVNRGTFEIRTDSDTALGEGGILPTVSGEAERVVTTVDSRGLATDDTIRMVVDRASLGEIQPRFISRNTPGLASERVAMKALGVSPDSTDNQEDRDLLLRAGLVQLVGSSAAPLANRLAQNFGIGMISAIYEPPETTDRAPTADSVKETGGTNSKANPLVSYLRGAGASARVRLTDRLSGVYKVKLDEARNQTYFRDQIELILRLQGSIYLRGSTELDAESLLGQPPERKLSLEKVWRFGWLKRRQKKWASESSK